MDAIRMDSSAHDTTQQGIRASDADRERTADLLKRHFLDGRLTTNEYSDRLDTAYAAPTREELQHLLDHLPPLATPAPDPPPDPPPARPRWRGIHPAAIVALIATLWLGAWVFGGPHGVVPVWPLLLWSFFLIRWAPWRLRQRR